ncbi:hypothetical protein ACFSVM_05760 [Paenibacillus shunpengii]|uniref:DUF4044 domain-containing protein n=1 Tax=Paenibacillus shunpengii TaxID=2054424 RepID=A0ABW5SKY2_9BACL|nr:MULTISPECIES: hypothetical protein [unclassified Paenibacillus]SDW19897.1 hypothetical protein SAMN05518848_101617 [Paenibacillus sp. PDC88]
MATKRQKPSLQQKKEEVNRKAVLWTALSVLLLIILIVALVIIGEMTTS